MKDADRLIFRRVMPTPPARVFALWTELLLEHGPFPESEIRALHAQGWENCFRRQHQLLQSAATLGP